MINSNFKTGTNNKICFFFFFPSSFSLLGEKENLDFFGFLACSKNKLL